MIWTEKVEHMGFKTIINFLCVDSSDYWLCNHFVSLDYVSMCKHDLTTFKFYSRLRVRHQLTGFFLNFKLKLKLILFRNI
jgi:hypothetical protein